MGTYTYIIAPKCEENLTKLWEFITAFPVLVSDGRIKTVFTKNENDVIGSEGQPVIYAGDTYYMVKALTADFSPEMLDGVIDPQLYDVDTLPYDSMWL